MKRLYTLSLLLSAAVFSASAVWDGTSAEPFTRGDGTAENPFLIKTEAQFIYFQRSVNAGEEYEGKHFSLTRNLDFGGFTINPVGFHDDYILDDVEIQESKLFLGTFNGNYRTIDNAVVALEAPDVDEIGGVGIFAAGRDNTVVKNLKVGPSVKVEGGNSVDVGGIMGISYGATIENCSFAGTVAGGSVENGGIVGYAKGGSTISGCIFSGTLAANSFSGGIAGAIDNSLLSDCLLTGNVDGNMGFWVAGIVGWALESKVSNCLAIGKVAGLAGSSFLPGISPVCSEFEHSEAYNCFYVEALTGCNPLSSQKGVTAKTEEEMRSDEMVAELNCDDSEGVWAKGDDGIPTLEWTLTGSTGAERIGNCAGANISVIGGEIIVVAENAVVSVFNLNGTMLLCEAVCGQATFAPNSKGIFMVRAIDASGNATVAKVVI